MGQKVVFSAVIVPRKHERDEDVMEVRKLLEKDIELLHDILEVFSLIAVRHSTTFLSIISILYSHVFDVGEMKASMGRASNSCLIMKFSESQVIVEINSGKINTGRRSQGLMKWF